MHLASNYCCCASQLVNASKLDAHPETQQPTWCIYESLQKTGDCLLLAGLASTRTCKSWGVLCLTSRRGELQMLYLDADVISETSGRTSEAKAWRRSASTSRAWSWWCLEARAESWRRVCVNDQEQRFAYASLWQEVYVSLYRDGSLAFAPSPKQTRSDPVIR